MRTAGTRKTFQFKENLQHFIFIAHIKVDKWNNLFGMCNEQVYLGLFLHQEFSSLKDVISSLTSAAKDLINHISPLFSLSLWIAHLRQVINFPWLNSDLLFAADHSLDLTFYSHFR